MTRTQRFAAAALLFLNLPSTGFGEYAFVWANNPTASSYVPDIDYQHNSTGAVNTITHKARGRYRVLMPNVQPKPYGNVQVTAYGSGSLFCNVGGWYKTGTADLDVRVFCFDAVGNPADSRFTVLYHDKAPPPNGEDLAYVYADQPNVSAYYAVLSYSHNSALVAPGAYATIYRSSGSIFIDDVGKYLVYFPGWEGLRVHPVTGLWDTTHGNVQVTTYGATPIRCGVPEQFYEPEEFGLPSGLLVAVHCYAPDGSAVDTRFSLTYSRDRVPGSPRTVGAYVNVQHDITWAGAVPFVGAFYNPLAPVTLPVITHLDEGRYRVDIQGLAHAYSKSTVQVVAKDVTLSFAGLATLPGSYCKVASWASVGDDVRVSVNCYNQSTLDLGGLVFPAGSPMDSSFYLSFVTDASY